jgi:hypothetical protein
MNKMKVTILNANYGPYETEDGNKGIFANCQTISDYAENGNKNGLQVGKTPVDTSNDFAVSKQIEAELRAKQGSIDVFATFGLGVSQGKTTLLIKSIEIPKGQ